jgi:16S rRNA (cytosine967-C5)-methyltransferase
VNRPRKRGNRRRNQRGRQERTQRSPAGGARALAGGIVRGVLAGRGAARTHIERAIEGDQLEARDEGLLTELVYGTVRHVATIDLLLGAHAKGGLRKIEEAVLNHLRVATYQLLFLEGVRPAVAVDEAVRAVGRRDHVRGFVNGLLRGLIRTLDGTQSEDTPPPDVPPSMRLPGREGGWVFLKRPLLPEDASDPNWLALACSLPGKHAAEAYERLGPAGALELARGHNAPPPLFLRVNTRQTSRAEALAYLNGDEEPCAEPGSLETSIRLRGGLGERGSELLWKGWVTVQDETAQAVAPLLEPLAGERLVDLCAAPGGKATHLAELIGPEGQLEALDVDQARLDRVGAAARRLRLENVRATLADPLDPRPPEGGLIDGVLADVPCSNTGVLRRRVEVRWRLESLDMLPLRALQIRLLDQAIALTRPGGRVVYSTCSIDPLENEEQVQAALARHPGLVLEAERSRLPERGGGDGGYAARLRLPS